MDDGGKETRNGHEDKEGNGECATRRVASESGLYAPLGGHAPVRKVGRTSK